MEQYVVLDFETANEARDSACSVGLVKYKDGQAIDEFYTLINPETYFDGFNISIHGITEDMVSGKPTYTDVYPLISKFIGNCPVVAHFAPFDTGVILAENKRYNLPNFEFDYFDSYYLSRFTLHLLSNKLDDVSKALGYSEFNHHNALADCHACGYVVNQLAIQTNSTDLTSLLAQAGYTKFGHIDQDDRHSFLRHYDHLNRSHINYSQIIKELVLPDIDKLDQDHPFFGKTMVFTGKLESMERKSAWQKSVDVGAIIGKNVTAKTNILVIGEQDSRVVGADGKSTKLEKAEKNLESGKDIELITESDFLRML